MTLFCLLLFTLALSMEAHHEAAGRLLLMSLASMIDPDAGGEV